MHPSLKSLLLILMAVACRHSTSAQAISITRPDGQPLTIASIDSTVKKLMDTAEVTGLCLGIINGGQIKYVQAYGYKNKTLKELNDTATCFYGASLSKALFAYIVMQLVDQGKIDLDKPVYTYLPKPLPEYNAYKDLAGDERWKLITARHCLDHTTGFPNWRQFNPVHPGKLELFFTPGQRYAYSGEGIYLLQLVVEAITGASLENLAQERVFRPFGMRRTSYVWQPGFETDYAVGHQINQDTIPKDKRSKANAAGSMETTIADYTRFVSAVLRGEGLSAKARQEMLSPQIAIFSRRQFPSLDTATTTENQQIQLSYGLGWGLFTSPFGKVFFKEGHGDGWQHYAMCLTDQQDAFILMTNSSNGESIFKELIHDLSGITIPWEWESYTPYRATVQLPKERLQEYVGNYVGKYNLYFSIADGHLQAQSPDAGLPFTQLYASNDHSFFLKTMDTQLDFVRGSDDKVAKAAVVDDGERYDLKKVLDTTLDKALLGLYAGTYHAGSDHDIVVTLKKGKLFAQGKNPKDHLPSLELHAFSATDFYLKAAALKFRFVKIEGSNTYKMVTYGSMAASGDWIRVEQP